jgi:hypothetical protein
MNFLGFSSDFLQQREDDGPHGADAANHACFMV